MGAQARRGGAGPFIVIATAILAYLAVGCGSAGETASPRGSGDTLEDVDPSIALEEQITRLPGVFLNEAGELRIRGASGPPLMVVDESPLEGRDLSFLDPADVARIEVLKGPETAIYGWRGGSGVIEITTKRGPEQDE